MAIDGYIYILVNKSILRFSGGLQEEYSLSGMEGHELENPVAIFASPDAQHVYVADAGAGRIVQLNKEGAFVRQFLPPRDDGDVFSTLRDVSVDEVGGRLIVLTSEGLFVSPIQQPPSTIQ
jgi:DNA-binding beta-propeller fold protein YncE